MDQFNNEGHNLGQLTSLAAVAGVGSALHVFRSRTEAIGFATVVQQMTQARATLEQAEAQVNAVLEDIGASEYLSAKSLPIPSHVNFDTLELIQGTPS